MPKINSTTQLLPHHQHQQRLYEPSPDEIATANSSSLEQKEQPVYQSEQVLLNDLINSNIQAMTYSSKITNFSKVNRTLKCMSFFNQKIFLVKQ